MSITFSKSSIDTFCGNVFSLRLISDEDLSKKDIKWFCQGDSVSIKTFIGDDEDCFNYGILITALSEGNSDIIAEVDGEAYKCHISVRKMRKFKAEECTNHYIGDLHDHTSLIHKPAEFATRTDTRAIDLVTQFRDEGKLDFAVVSDHACLVPKDDFFAGFVAAEECSGDGLVVFAGTESEVTDIRTDRFGYTHKESGEIVTINANNYAAVKTFEEYYDTFKDSPFVIASFAHPQVIGWDMNGIWNFRFDRNCTPELKRMVKLIEVGDGSKESESHMIDEYAYSLALDYGFKVSPVSASDNHGPVWGYDMWEGKTVILAAEKSKEAFLDALMNHRTYATQAGNVKLYYTVNGRCPSETLEDAEKYSFHVETGTLPYAKAAEIVRLEVISDGGKCVYCAENEDFSSFDFMVESDTASYFYLRLTDKNNYFTWSSPVWTGRCSKFVSVNRDKPIYIDKTEFFATDDEGNVCNKVINNNTKHPWASGKKNPSITVDMKKIYKVNGISYAGYHFIRPECNDENPPAKRIAEFVADYRVFTSMDGKNFEFCTEGCIRAFGGETEIYFDNPVIARFVRFDVIKTVGAKNGDRVYADVPAVIGEISIF